MVDRSKTEGKEVKNNIILAGAGGADGKWCCRCQSCGDGQENKSQKGGPNPRPQNAVVGPRNEKLGDTPSFVCSQLQHRELIN